MAGESRVEIGYNSRLAVLLGVSAALVAALFWVRALTGGSPLDGVVAAVVSLLAVACAVVAVSGRSPLLVADRRGVRAKIGGEWCGFPWVSLSDFRVEPRRLPWGDGRLLLEVSHSSHLTESLSQRSRRRVATSQRRHHAELSVPLGVVTGISRRSEQQVAGVLAELALRGGEPE